MNILPFVLSFLLLMALLAGSLLKEVKGLALENRVVIGEIHATQKLLSKMAKKNYEDQKTEKAPPTNPPKEGKTISQPALESEEEKKDGKPRKRYYYCKTEWSKFQLSSILDQPSSAKSAAAYHTAAALIQDLYGHTTFWKEARDSELAHKIIDKLILWKEGEIAAHFTDDAPLSMIFHKMLRGTNTYDIQNKKGYPPFFDFFTLAKGANGKAVVFLYASYPVLQAALGKEPSEALSKKEKTEKVTKSEFIALLEAFPEWKKFPSRLEDFFYFGGLKETATLAKDSSTKVTTRLKRTSYLQRNSASAWVDAQ